MCPHLFLLIYWLMPVMVHHRRYLFMYKEDGLTFL